MPHPLKCVGLGLTLATLASLFAAEPAAVAPSDTVLHSGSLPNGLRYVVLPHNSPTGDLSLRLAVDAGSLDETDSERGFAHFVEHMAFNGTRNLPSGALRYFFQQLGLGFGSHVNASTSYTQTIYKLDLTRDRHDRLDQSLLVLRDFADGILFQPEEVTQEAGVVLSELRTRDSMDARIGRAVLDTVFAGTRVPERTPIGLAEQIEGATAEQLRAFYTRNYVPSRMTVVIVGDVDPAATIAKIADAFGSMVAPAEITPAAPAIEPPEFAGIRPTVLALPTIPSAQIQLIHLAPQPPDTAEGRREEQMRRLATGILDLRFRQLKEANPTRFGSARVLLQPIPFGSMVQYTLSTGMRPEDWEAGVRVAETELRRALEVGFTQEEVDEAVARRLSSLRSAETDWANLPSAGIADSQAQRAATQRGWQPPEAGFREVRQAVSGLTAEELTAALSRMFPSDSLHLMLLAPPERAMNNDRLLAEYNQSAARSLRERDSDADALVFRYTDFGQPGAVAQREYVEDLDLTLVAFGNGVRVNLRPTQLEPERFRLRVQFPKNYSNVTPQRGGLIDLSTQLFASSSLRRHPLSEMTRLFALHGIRMQWTSELGTPVLQMRGPSEEIPFALQFLTALFSDLRLQDDSYNRALSAYSGLFRRTSVNVGSMAVHHALYSFTGSDSRVIINNTQMFANANARSDAEKWLREHLLNGPLEIGLVGDFTAEGVVTTAAATVGTLDQRRPVSRAGGRLTSVAKAVRHESEADTPAGASVSAVLWPVELADDPRQEAALTVATEVLKNRLLLALREILGAAYSPLTRTHRDLVQRDFAFVAIVNSFNPPQARQFTEGTIRLAERLAQAGIRPDEFTRALEPLRTRSLAQVRDNDWWLESIAVAQTRPAAIDAARRHQQIYQEITLEEVNAAAAQVFKSDRVTVMIVNPQTKTAASDAR